MFRNISWRCIAMLSTLNSNQPESNLQIIKIIPAATILKKHRNWWRKIRLFVFFETIYSIHIKPISINIWILRWLSTFRNQFIPFSALLLSWKYFHVQAEWEKLSSRGRKFEKRFFFVIFFNFCVSNLEVLEVL